MQQSRLDFLGIQIKQAAEYEADVNIEFEKTINEQILAQQQEKLDSLAVEIQDLNSQINGETTTTISLGQLKRRLQEKEETHTDLAKKVKFLNSKAHQQPSEEDDVDGTFENKIRKGILMPLDCQKKQIQSGGIVNFNLEEEQELDSEEDTNNLSISKSIAKLGTDLEADDTEWETYRERVCGWKYFAEFVTRNSDDKKYSYSLGESEKYLDETFFVPTPIYRHLFRYQKTGIRWLHALFKQRIGGILADEMGLGKTIQVVGFVSGLFSSAMNCGKSVLIVCPVTLMQQWMDEFHRWFPIIPVRMLHSQTPREHQTISSPSYTNACVIVTSYSFLQLNPQIFTSSKHDWSSVFLDEGHKIRNYNTSISEICRSLPCKHRIIISGTPIQNNLSELWSLFDFVFPGRLGSHPIFQAEFEDPIKAGGYVNATSLQVETAYRCSIALKTLISPFMLRRLKADVAAELPEKQEHILFCKLTEQQQHFYRAFLRSEDFELIFSGKKHVLCGIDYLRKVCNHLDLINETLASHVTQGFKQLPAGINDPICPVITEKSGKFNVLFLVLSQWHNKHKALIFCQTRQMLNIIEEHIKRNTEYSYLRMDGNTPINQRNNLINKFNTNKNIFLFLLTTKVGGLGINLVGADRVVIFDPDWNPSTDTQARERAWRLGQDKPVMIFRLITVGTIEEKIYHRQIFKQFLTNKILIDPRQCRFFKSNDLYDLFSFTDVDDTVKSETSELFAAQSQRITSESDNILDTITSTVGIHSIFDHTSTSDTSYNGEYLLVKNEAERIANSALETLKNSQTPKNNISSSKLPFKPVVKLQNKTGNSNALIDLLKPSTQSNTSNSSQLLTRMIEYFHYKQGKIDTDSILKRFESENVKPVIFKSLLQRISSFDKNEKRWILKAEFKKK